MFLNLIFSAFSYLLSFKARKIAVAASYSAVIALNTAISGSISFRTQAHSK
jgi:hypothetical protein